MARKGLTGQLNMFDLWNNLDNVPMGDVEMVSLMPSDEVEEVQQPEEISQVEQVHKPEEIPPVEKVQKPEEIPQVEQVQQPEIPPQVEQVHQPEGKPRKRDTVKKRVSITVERPAMSRTYEVDGKKLEIAYINYNKVRITREGEEPKLCEFASSKEAVDYYVEKMQELEPEE